MNIRNPENKDIPILKDMWRQAFKDDESYIDLFFSTAFSTNRALVCEVDGQLASMLYWFDCDYNGKTVAYVYAVATFEAFRKKGLCSALMDALHSHLKASGYVGACLVASSLSLSSFYAKMGYLPCIYVSEEEVSMQRGLVDFKKISINEYFNLRKQYLPEHSITQRQNEFLNGQIDFFKGDDFIFALRNDEFFVVEFFGNKNMQPYILFSQNIKKGVFRTIGNKTPFAMYLPLEETLLPEYLDFAYD